MSTLSTKPPTPELDRQSHIIRSGKALIVQEFYDWLHEQGWQVCSLEDSGKQFFDGEEVQQWYPIGRSLEDLMADFFRIDRNKIEQERRALLDHIQANL